MMLISFCATLPAAGEVHGEEVTYEAGGVELTGYLAYDEVPSIPPDLTPAQLKEAAGKYLSATRQVRITPVAN